MVGDMNYTTYILTKHPFSPDLMISEKPYLKELTTAIVLPAAIVGVFVNLGLVPCAVLIDLTCKVKAVSMVSLKTQKEVHFRRPVKFEPQSRQVHRSTTNGCLR